MKQYRLSDLEENGFVLISYRNAELSRVLEVLDVLDLYDIKYWIAPYSILGGKKYEDEIYEAIEKCGAIVLMLSNAAQKSEWIAKEIDKASICSKPIIPYKIEQCELRQDAVIYHQVEPFQWIDGFCADKRDGYEKLVASIKRNTCSWGLAFSLNRWSGGHCYTLINRGINRDKNVNLPKMVEGLPLVCIGDGAFENTDVQSVTLPETITTIEGGAFASCPNLEYVDWSAAKDSLTSIGARAFSNCKKLKSFNWPEGVTKIDVGTFEHCDELEEVNIPSSVNDVSSDAFSDCKALKFAKYKGCNYVGNAENPYHVLIGPESYEEITSIEVHPDTKIIANRAFDVASQVESVTIPGSVTKIGERAFLDMTELSALELNYGIEELGEEAFSCCDSLKEVLIPDSVTKLGGYLFEGCSSLQKVRLPNGIKEIPCNAFSECESLRTLIIPDSVEKLCRCCFEGCKSLRQLYLPNNYLLRLDERVFHECDSLVTTKFNNALYLGSRKNPYLLLCKAVNTKIKRIKIHSHTKIIGACAFKDCKKLKNVVIPGGVRSVHEYAFGGCASMESIVIPSAIQAIEKNCLEGCISLTNVEINENSVSLGGEGDVVRQFVDNLALPARRTKIIKKERHGQLECQFDGTVEEFNEIASEYFGEFSTVLLAHCTDGDYTCINPHPDD